ncbi:NAD(P)/FAD-dependent oxidoreductase [Citricoccus sp. K5]|uniref:FAD-dependent oxidoreductase n=1 Tax=Citricoccus sp. K5 TaxID=2653135 RepID=UPI0012F14B69|nr:NAD(P)/FAD-dependent oxidoreductase [Citricoccus sp. K5]VXB68662.1 2-polyprenyl-6-methoxyphenol hydroxylase and related FAD-dependent oxidoreductases [Citricoccus sp. K5]
MHADVLIVGAGPVGLFLAGLLAARGVDVTVLERREHPPEHSRAIGLHPPALDALAVLGLDRAAVAEGVTVRRGVGYGDGRLLGEITFDQAHPRYPFVLTLPQSRTEQLLAGHLERLAPGAVHRGVEVVAVEDHDAGAPVLVTARTVAGETRRWSAQMVVGADGAHSTVRRLAGVGVDRRDWGDSYLMGDFAESGSGPGAEPTAVIQLHRDGVVESFPLPGGQRRWVVHTGRQQRLESAGDLVALVRERWGERPGENTSELLELPHPATATMVSAFTVYRQLARRMVAGRTVVIGDAAHAISPIGGQGMTVGWLDALALAPLLTGLFQGPPDLGAFERDRLRAARRAARMAEVNMVLGRPLWAVARCGRDALARAALSTPAKHRLARLYSMGGVIQR